MLAASRLQVLYSNFSQIFNEVMLPKYSSSEREEMVQLLEEQTLSNHLHFLSEHHTMDLSGFQVEDMTELVWEVVQQSGGRSFACQELFLGIFDRATKIHEQRNVKADLLDSHHNNAFNTPTETKVNERDLCLTRKIENLVEENEMLKSEIEEKAKTIMETEEHLKNLQYQVRRYSEAFDRLENEKLELKGSIDDLRMSNDALVEDFAEKEKLLEERIENLESEIQAKQDECSELAREHVATLADVNTLSCEIGERDLVISSLTSKLEETVQVLEEKEEEDFARTSRFPASPWRDSPDCSFDNRSGICLGEELEKVCGLTTKSCIQMARSFFSFKG